ncbi:hypothetical protein BH11PLA1_BH11PLA1_01880 [soil metagenome]
MAESADFSPPTAPVLERPATGPRRDVALAIRRAPIVGPALTIAVGVVAAMWIAFFVVHLPAIAPLSPAPVAGSLLLAIMLVGVTLGCSRVPAGQGTLVGALAGLFLALINLLILGSYLTRPLDTGADAGPNQAAAGVQGIRPDAALMIGGFVLFSVIVGIVGGLIGAALARRRGTGPESAQTWLARLAAATCFAIVPLLALGGLVTSTGSGLAVPDWPGTYGANMVLYPIGLMSSSERVFLEHSHRLFGAMVGLCAGLTFAYSIYALLMVGRKKLLLVGLALVVLVGVQGALGGARVIEGVQKYGKEWPQYLAVAHGVLAQAYFALSVAFAVACGPRWDAARNAALAGAPEAGPPGARGAARWLLPTLVICIFTQLIFGALYRHTHSLHPLWAHVGFSIVVLGFAHASAVWSLRQKNGGRPFRRGGLALMHAVNLQFVLGLIALLLVLGTDKPTGVASPDAVANGADTLSTRELWTGAVRTVHQANGALVLAAGVGVLMWSRTRKT